LKVPSLSKLAWASAALILSLSIFAIIGVCMANTANFTVEPLKEYTITLSLHETDTVSGSFSVVSNDQTGINFYITGPGGNTFLSYDNVLQKNFSFTANSTGDYQLHFNNSVSSTYAKTVSLDYNSVRYIMGMPEEQFLFVVIAVFAVVGIVVYLVLMPKRLLSFYCVRFRFSFSNGDAIHVYDID
jgi:hypothetical protein